MIQLDLFPERCFGILLPGEVLAVDIYERWPRTFRTKRTAKRHLDKTMWRDWGRVVPVEIHNGDTFVVQRAS